MLLRKYDYYDVVNYISCDCWSLKFASYLSHCVETVNVICNHCRPSDRPSVRPTLDANNCCPLLSPSHANRLGLTRKWCDSDHHDLMHCTGQSVCHCSGLTRIERFYLQQADIRYDSIWQNISISVSVSIIKTALIDSNTPYSWNPKPLD